MLFLIALILLAGAQCTSVTTTGVLMDNLCIKQGVALDGFDTKTEAEKHTVHCLLMTVCIASGYSVMKNTASAGAKNAYTVEYMLNDDGNVKALEFLKKIDAMGQKDNVWVTVKGNKVNETHIAVDSIVASQPVKAGTVSSTGKMASGLGTAAVSSLLLLVVVWM